MRSGGLQSHIQVAGLSAAKAQAEAAFDCARICRHLQRQDELDGHPRKPQLDIQICDSDC